MKTRLFWIFLVVMVLLAGGVLNVLSQSPEFVQYLPIVMQQVPFTATYTFTPTFTRTATFTTTPTSTLTATFTVTPSRTLTFTPSASPTRTNTSTPTPVTTPPLWSRTAYINTDGGNIIYNLGCEAGTRDKNTAGKQDTVVVLDFGSPTEHSSDGTYGTSLFGIGYLRDYEIALRVQMYGQGYYVCAGTDRESQMTVAIGTTNYGSWLTQGSNARDHGRAWANMVNDVNAWFVQNGYASQVTAVGASDIELTWNGPTVSRAWVDGYDETNLYDMYDFGDMAGCPSRDRPGAVCALPWTMNDVWYVAYGSPPAYPLPLIYANSGVNARQWSWLSLWSFLNKGSRMEIVGAFTQCQACLQITNDTSCPYLDNKPAEGWQQLYASLIVDGVSQGLRWSTDIFWLGSTQINPNLCNTSKAPQVSGSLEGRAIELQRALTGDDLAVDMKVNLEEKLATTRRVLAQQAESPQAEKVSPTSFPQVGTPLFETGIFPGDAGLFRPWQMQINNRWQGWAGEEKVLVLAGQQVGEAGQGVVFVWRSGQDETWLSYTAPDGGADLRIILESDGWLVLQTGSGEILRFHWPSGKFLN